MHSGNRDTRQKSHFFILVFERFSSDMNACGCNCLHGLVMGYVGYVVIDGRMPFQTFLTHGCYTNL